MYALSSFNLLNRIFQMGEQIQNIDYNLLIGKDKNFILEKIGDGFNFYPDDTWVYDIKVSWWGRKTALVILFSRSIVERVAIAKYYGKNLKNKNRYK